MSLVTRCCSFKYYKIEECFLNFSSLHEDIVKRCQKNLKRDDNRITIINTCMCFMGMDGNTPFIIRSYGFFPFFFVESRFPNITLGEIINKYGNYIVDYTLCDMVPFNDAYRGRTQRYIKLHVSHSKYKREVVKKLTGDGYVILDNKTNGILQYMTIQNIAPVGIISPKPFTIRYAMSDTFVSRKKECVEFDVYFNDLIPQQFCELTYNIDPFNDMLWMAFDIENLFQIELVNDNNNVFPIILISVVLFKPMNFEIVECGLFTMKKLEVEDIAIKIRESTRVCMNDLKLSHINPENVFVKECDNEKTMLELFIKYVHSKNVVVMTGFNSATFDYDQICKRYSFLNGGRSVEFGIHKAANTYVNKRYCKSKLNSLKNQRKVTEFFHLKNNVENIHKLPIDAKSRGAVVDTIQIPGLYHFDLMRYYISNEAGKHSRYSLNCISQNKLVGISKDDVRYEDIYSYWMGNNQEKRNELAKYCLTDSLLVCFLIFKDELACFLLVQSLLCNTDLQEIMNCRSLVCTYSNLYREAYKQGLCFFHCPDFKKISGRKLYRGAKVFDPEIGFYNQPIACLDFKGQYAHIMIGRNTCFSSHITYEYIVENNLVEGDDYFVSEISLSKNNKATKLYFIAPIHYKSVTANVVERLKNARDEVKVQLKNIEIDIRSLDKSDCDETLISQLEHKISILNTQQLAIKRIANSVYGFFGAQFNKGIAESITYFARKDILAIKTFLENYSAGTLKIKYGDTDSVFTTLAKSGDIHELESQLNEAGLIRNNEIITRETIIRGFFKLGEYLCDIMNNGSPARSIQPVVPAPSVIEMEKIMFPVFFFAKKSYFGIVWDTFNNPSLMVKGLACIKSDSSLLQQIVQHIIINDVLKGDFKRMCLRLRQISNSLMQLHIPVSWVSLKKRISRPLDQYKANALHVKLAREECARLGVEENHFVNQTIEYVHVIDEFGKKTTKSLEYLRCNAKSGFIYDTRRIYRNQIEKFSSRVLDILARDGFISSSVKKSATPSITRSRYTPLHYFSNKKKVFCLSLCNDTPSELLFINEYKKINVSCYTLPQLFQDKKPMVLCKQSNITDYFKTK